VSHVARTFARRDMVLFIACLVLSLVAQGLPERLRDPLAAALRRTVVAPLIALQRDAELTRRAWLTREQRAIARDSVLLRSMTLHAVESENAKLRRLLGLGQQLRWGFVPAEVLQGGAVGEPHMVTLSAGSRAGVRAFSPVVAPDGLVGMVRAVDPTMSSAIVWPHPDFRVSAMTADGSAFGIVAAHSGNEPEHSLLEMRGVPVRSRLKPNTLVVSSGLGGVHPRGIPIGTVLGELKTSEVWARTYLLRPAVMPADASAVMILQARRGEAGVETIWAAGRSLDSAVQGVVAAGDSLARLAKPEGVAPLRSERHSLASGRDSLASPRDSLAAGVVGPTRAGGAVPRPRGAALSDSRGDTTPESGRRPILGRAPADRER
jgi:rod shape-determining protein MreC